MSNALKLRRRLCAVAWAVAASMAQAVDWGLSDSALHELSFDATNQLLTSQVLREATAPSRGARASRPSNPSTLAPARSASVARQLASHLPASERDSAVRHYEGLLQSYRQVETRFDIPRNDVAGAVAVFTAGNVAAYRNADFPDGHFQALVSQMRAALGASPAFQAADATARRDMYERLAIIGMSMASTQLALARQPDPLLRSKLQAAARRYIEQFLKVDPARVDITSRGLVIR